MSDAPSDRYQEQVYRFGMKMCRDSDDAQDVLQDTLLAVAAAGCPDVLTMFSQHLEDGQDGAIMEAPWRP